MVARDENGQILNAWAKEHIPCDPLQAEAAALFWTVQLAIEKDFKHVIIEGDSKICIDALNGNLNSVNWSISSIVCNISELCKYFSSYSFFWTRREANGVAHSLAKAASSLDLLSFSATIVILHLFLVLFGMPGSRMEFLFWFRFNGSSFYQKKSVLYIQ